MGPEKRPLEEYFQPLRPGSPIYRGNQATATKDEQPSQTMAPRILSGHQSPQTETPDDRRTNPLTVGHVDRGRVVN